MDKQQKTIEVYCGEQCGGDFPGYNWTLPEVIAWLQEKLELIPEEYRAQSICEICAAGGYEGDHYGKIVISYRRLETDEEAAERVRSHERFAAFEERRLLEALERVRASRSAG